MHNQQQIAVNTDEIAIRAALGKKLGEAHVQIEVLSEQVQALAIEKLQLEDKVQRLQSVLQPAEAHEANAPEVIDTPIEVPVAE